DRRRPGGPGLGRRRELPGRRAPPRPLARRGDRLPRPPRLPHRLWAGRIGSRGATPDQVAGRSHPGHPRSPRRTLSPTPTARVNGPALTRARDAPRLPADTLSTEGSGAALRRATSYVRDDSWPCRRLVPSRISGRVTGEVAGSGRPVKNPGMRKLGI